MICYLDSSVVLRNIFNADNAYREFDSFSKIGSSELLVIECNRVIDRYRLENILTDSQVASAKDFLKKIIEGIYIIGINESIKARAADTFPTIIGTLDAIHVSTAIVWQEYENNEEMTIVSHDRQMNICVKALGYHIIE
ncbi:MAG TPA: PIN domain-containing protein [Spirochaetota bacterium]|nr:PIN domain-containing protein [Spirochaetota bacterium]HQO01108.1 PIN domain-containing protein [Spirochaetota bacterium]HQP48720.1 PIN domain-containing protein [Spirochaetota bacterium]